MKTIIEIMGVAYLMIHWSDFVDVANSILKKPKRVLLIILGKALECFRCTAFWIALIYTGDIGLSGFISLLAFTIDKYIISSPTRL